MTLFRLLLTALLFQSALSQGGRPGSIHGVVVNDITGAPVSGARVEVMGVQAGRVLARSVRTDAKGTFRFDSLPPGSGYQLVVTGEGLQPIAHGQRSWDDPWVPLTLEPGQQLRDVRIGVRLPAAIRGRVVDSRGGGLAGASVRAMAPAYKEGRRVLVEEQSTVTNSSGNYQFPDISPGVYYIRALPRNNDPTTGLLLSEPAELDRPAGPRTFFTGEPEGHPLTYFPSSTTADSARAVTAVSGETVNNIDITVVRVRTSRVQGSITHYATGTPLTSGQVVMQRPGSSPQSNWTRISEVKNGQFDIRAVLPGPYIAWVRATENGVPLWGRMPVEVVGGKTLQIDLKASSASMISGRITLEGAETTEPDFTRLSVHLVPDVLAPIDGTLSRAEFELPALAATPDKDGQFTLRDAPPWSYRVIVAPGFRTSSNVPIELGRVYVKSIRNGDTDIANNGLQVSDAFTGSLDIVLASDSGGLDGRVLNENRQETARARVALVPDARQRIDLYFSMIATSTGRFQFQGVPPGSYKVFAWRNAPAGAWLDPDFLRAYEDRATTVNIEPDAAEYVELQWMH